jgi:nicotinamide riboside transporter PnuC
MKLSAPKATTWWIAVVVGVVGILSSVLAIPVLSGFAFWLVAIGFVIFAVATAVTGL